MGSISKTIVSCFVFISASCSVLAQKGGYKWMIGANAGAMIYQGDLTPSAFGSYKTASFTVGISAAKILDPYFAIRANAVFGKLRGDDAAYKDPAWRQSRNLNFTSPVTELSAQFIWNPYGNNSHETGQRLTPYLFAGAGVSFVNIKRDYSRMDTTLFSSNAKLLDGIKTDSARTPPRSLFVLPVGAGLSYYLAPRWSINYEFTYRYTFTDYLDGFSYAANPNQKDYYHSHTLGIVYRFGGSGGGNDRLGCPAMKY